eukprot:scaffold34700_cov466-Skeletonema_dohrnii-CCMP3373.AAC.1
MALEILHPTWISSYQSISIGVSIFISGIRSAIAYVYISARETMPFALELGIFTSKTATYLFESRRRGDSHFSSTAFKTIEITDASSTATQQLPYVHISTELKEIKDALKSS